MVVWWKNGTTFHLFVINKQAKDNLLVELPFFQKITDGKKVFGGTATATLGYINTVCVCLQNIKKETVPAAKHVMFNSTGMTWR